MKDKFRQLIGLLKDTDTDISIRLFYVAGFAILIAILVGTAGTLMFATSYTMLISNAILFLFIIAGLYISYFRKKFELASILLIIGCGYISLPIMFFTSGGNHSGMVLWFIFGVVFCCVLAKGKNRIIVPFIMVVIAAASMLTGYFHPELVSPLDNETAVFFDTFQSFIIVSIMLLATLRAYLSTYDGQRKILEEQSEELKELVYTDTLTGIANRQAYYEKINAYKDVRAMKDLVVVAMDLNGLKAVNDTKGHAAGDGFLRCAADCITAAFSNFGSVYRTGGDEFMAVLFCQDSVVEKLPDMLERSILASSDENADGMTVAIGIAAWNMENGIDFFELEKLADARMYQDKKDYYTDSGKDRRKY